MIPLRLESPATVELAIYEATGRFVRAAAYTRETKSR